MEVSEVIIISVSIVYSLSLLYIFLFSLGQLHLALIYRKEIRKEPVPLPFLVQLPTVTVQLPVYNEKYVIERLLDAIGKLDYPKNLLEVQVLDDSTDETAEIIQNKSEHLRDQGLNIHVIHREDRTGFKAGALANGLKFSSGEFIAIFDADFIPNPDFLLKTLPHFINNKIGVVQTRWGHINRNYSLLTQLQAFGLDAHFSIEQTARKAAGSFINFNGTCGVWRKSCIEDAGGWSADTLTEDLDLSYRAQLRGWEFRYCEEIETPGELPVIMSAIKSQQYRWNKGAAETARKNFGRVWRGDFYFKNKVHAFFHLFNSSVFVFILIASLLSIPMLWIKATHPEIDWLFHAGTIFLFGFFSITFFYWIATKRFHRQLAAATFLSLYPKFLIVSMGLSFHNGLAVLEGWAGRKSPFIRTPKFNITHGNDSWFNNSYVRPRFTLGVLAEGLLAIYFVGGIAAAIWLQEGGLIFFHLMLALGFGSVFYFSMKSSLHA